MGLIVPPGGSWIKVGGETRPWKEGQCLVFDDSFEHEVQVVQGPRVVLLLHFWHPDIPEADWPRVAEEEQAIRRGAGGRVCSH